MVSSIVDYFKLEREIDEMVFELYDLSEKEKEIVLNN
jgi:hypothetical protein